MPWATGVFSSGALSASAVAVGSGSGWVAVAAGASVGICVGVSEGVCDDVGAGSCDGVGKMFLVRFAQETRKAVAADTINCIASRRDMLPFIFYSNYEMTGATYLMRNDIFWTPSGCLGGHRLQHVFWLKWQPPQTRSGQGKKSIAYGRGNRPHWGFAHAARLSI